MVVIAKTPLINSFMENNTFNSDPKLRTAALVKHLCVFYLSKKSAAVSGSTFFVFVIYFYS